MQRILYRSVRGPECNNTGSRAPFQTRLRGSIRFDVLVNGGGAVTLQFQRSPFKPLTRTVFVPWNQIVVLPPVVMTLDKEGESHKSHQPPSPAVGKHLTPPLRCFLIFALFFPFHAFTQPVRVTC